MINCIYKRPNKCSPVFNKHYVKYFKLQSILILNTNRSKVIWKHTNYKSLFTSHDIILHLSVNLKISQCFEFLKNFSCPNNLKAGKSKIREYCYSESRIMFYLIFGVKQIHLSIMLLSGFYDTFEIYEVMILLFSKLCLKL